MLTLHESSLPSLENTPAQNDQYWRVRLTITEVDGLDQIQVYFRFLYLQCEISFATAVACPRTTSRAQTACHDGL